jgi:hypothetical protein
MDCAPAQSRSPEAFAILSLVADSPNLAYLSSSMPRFTISSSPIRASVDRAKTREGKFEWISVTI